jgi:hypothetical protein
VEEREARHRSGTLLEQLRNNISVLEAPADNPAPSRRSEEGAEEPAEAAPGPAAPGEWCRASERF